MKQRFFIPNWNPQDAIMVSFSDQTSKARSQEELADMMDKFCEIANSYGFDLSGWGTKSAMEAWIVQSRRRRR